MSNIDRFIALNDEFSTLIEKMPRLKAVIDDQHYPHATSPIPKEELALLKAQYAGMKQYAEALSKRIDILKAKLKFKN